MILRDMRGERFRAGEPTIVVPFLGDQPFWGNVAFQRGVGPEPILRKKLTVKKLTTAIDQAISDESIRSKAAALGKKIQLENGVRRAVEIVKAFDSEQ